MAIYHCSVKTIGRSKGRSAVGASAYRSGEKIVNERDGIIHDYTYKKEIMYKEIQKPPHAPEWVMDRSKLWNEVEKIEKAINSRLAREIELGLPKELTRREQIELVKEYTKENFTDKGMVADIAIHDKGDGNPHAHIMLTTRPFTEEGTWGNKCKKEYVLDAKGEKIRDRNGKYKFNKVDLVDWNKKETCKNWRVNWAKTANKHLGKAGHQERIDHRSYKEQGIVKIPTKHEGAIARKIDKRGERSYMVEENKVIKEENRVIELLENQVRNLERQHKQERERIEGEKLQESQQKIKVQREEEREREKKQEGHKEGEKLDLEMFKVNQIKREEIKFEHRDNKYEERGYSRLERGSATYLEGDANAAVRNVKVDYSKLQQPEQVRQVEIQDIKNINYKIEKHENNIKALEKEKQQVKGIFKGKEIKRLEKAIGSEQQAVQNQERILKEDHGISRHQVDNKMQQLYKESIQQENEKTPLKDRINAAREQQEKNQEQENKKVEKHKIQGRER